MTNLKNPSWWNFATTRAIKTFAQTFIATVGTSAIIDDVNWQIVLSASLLSMLLSYMTSLAGLPEVEYEGYDSDELD